MAARQGQEENGLQPAWANQDAEIDLMVEHVDHAIEVALPTLGEHLMNHQNGGGGRPTLAKLALLAILELYARS
jgi:hypothetical protein